MKFLRCRQIEFLIDDESRSVVWSLKPNIVSDNGSDISSYFDNKVELVPSPFFSIYNSEHSFVFCYDFFESWC